MIADYILLDMFGGASGALDGVADATSSELAELVLRTALMAQTSATSSELAELEVRSSIPQAPVRSALDRVLVPRLARVEITASVRAAVRITARVLS